METETNPRIPSLQSEAFLACTDRRDFSFLDEKKKKIKKEEEEGKRANKKKEVERFFRSFLGCFKKFLILGQSCVHFKKLWF